VGAAAAGLGWDVGAFDAACQTGFPTIEKAPTNNARVRQAANPNGQATRRFGRGSLVIA